VDIKFIFIFRELMVKMEEVELLVLVDGLNLMEKLLVAQHKYGFF